MAIDECLATLFLAHGSIVFTLIVVQFILAFCCLILWSVFRYKQPKTSTTCVSSIKSKTINTRTIFNLQLIVIPFIFTLTTFVLISNGVFHLHRETPPYNADVDIECNTTTTDAYGDCWMNHVESICSIDLVSTGRVVAAITASLLAVQSGGLLIIYFLRLVLIFEGSVAAIPYKTKMIFYMALFLYFIGYVACAILDAFTSDPQIQTIFAIVGMITTVTYIFLIIFVQKTLLKQFKVIIKMTMVTKHNAPSKCNNVSKKGIAESKCNDHINTSAPTQGHHPTHIKFLQTLVRLTVLFLVSFIGTLATAIVFYAVLISQSYDDTTHTNRAIWDTFGVLLFVMDCFFNITGIVLQFPYMDTVTCNIYHKCCGVCDTKCNEKCKKKMIQKATTNV